MKWFKKYLLYVNMAFSCTTDMSTDASLSANNVNVTPFNAKLSVYIPIVDENINDTTIKAVFEHLGLGIISRVDFVYSSLGKKQAFLHFEAWYECDKARKVQRDILNSDCNARLVYDNPKFWPLLLNRNPIENPKLSTPNIIDVLQTKIQMLENKLNSIGITPDYEGLGKRPRNSHGLPFMNVILPRTPSQAEMSAAFHGSFSPPPLRRMQPFDSPGSVSNEYLPNPSSIVP